MKSILPFLLILFYTFPFQIAENAEHLSMDEIKNVMKNYILNDSTIFSYFSFLYLYNMLRCTLTQKVFNSYPDQNYEKEILIVKEKLSYLNKNSQNMTQWIFADFKLPQLLLSSIEEIEKKMKTQGINFIQMYNELRMASPTFRNISNLTLEVCYDSIFSVEEFSMQLTILPFILDKLEISDQKYKDEVKYMISKTFKYFSFFISIINDHNNKIIDIYKKEINVFIKVKENFHIKSLNGNNLLSLYDEIYLKNKYGEKLIQNLFVLFKKIFFLESTDDIYYFKYIDVVPIYIKTINGLYKSRKYNMEKNYFTKIENKYKNNLKINEGIILIKTVKQYIIDGYTNNPTYFDSDVIYKTIIQEIHEPIISSKNEDTQFQLLYSENVDETKEKKFINDDVTLSLIILTDTNINIKMLLDHMNNMVLSEIMFSINKGPDKERIKLMGTCIYTNKLEPPTFTGFFSRGLSTYTLNKVISLLKPNKQLIYLSIQKTEDASQMKSDVIAERIFSSHLKYYETVLLFERDGIIKYDELKNSYRCDMCLTGYNGLYTLYVCILLPIILSLIICYYIYKRKKWMIKNKIDVNSVSMKNKRMLIEPNILPLNL
ncbi:conserved Plasmodium protein, unknown function [Plasmodium yoelii]|uniref:Uncharacterized protein n=1 Tax=Plasmodium yoelii TaxID=5861 RepID=A0A077Y393_PLAYE|nr:conserved Plasmodium protein, unknown function [Plasmodium yoelii]CDU16757.1 conserved Plasmodium protein, unknown function [Plasmodium yoelii]VTZ74340.1 conserved Plasmodium protein, unknown function [Plasmodium yoelii]|eukprot:XP_022811686.1 conserved Plasmodium protein, unknown function [Plasmodium yoelii]